MITAQQMEARRLGFGSSYAHGRRVVPCGPCLTCGKSFMARERSGRGKYCSHRCMWNAKKLTPEKFWLRVDKSGGENSCWNWLGSTTEFGYGKLNRSSAHRYSYELAFGAIPDGMGVLHKCDNPSCVNPAHLLLGTNSDNCADKVEKRRHPRHETSGKAKLTLIQVVEIRKLLGVGSETQGQIGERFGVSASAIGSIAHGRSWSEEVRHAHH